MLNYRFAIKKFKQWANKQEPTGTSLWKALIFQGRLPTRYRQILNDISYFSINNPIESSILVFKILKGKLSNKHGMLQNYGLDVLEEVLLICRKLNMKPFLVFGTLLGYYRENGFIKHDSDIDLGLLEEDFNKINILKKIMKKNNFLIRDFNKYEISFFKPECPYMNIDFWLFYKKNNKIAYSIKHNEKKYTFYFSSDIFENFHKQKFLDKIEVLIPHKPEKFLTECYGDWKTPIKNFDNIRGHPNLEK